MFPPDDDIRARLIELLNKYLRDPDKSKWKLYNGARALPVTIKTKAFKRIRDAMAEAQGIKNPRFTKIMLLAVFLLQVSCLFFFSYYYYIILILQIALACRLHARRGVGKLHFPPKRKVCRVSAIPPEHNTT
jgi:hypothetical protein